MLLVSLMEPTEIDKNLARDDKTAHGPIR